MLGIHIIETALPFLYAGDTYFLELTASDTPKTRVLILSAWGMLEAVGIHGLKSISNIVI